jgi:plastocyanin
MGVALAIGCGGGRAPDAAPVKEGQAPAQQPATAPPGGLSAGGGFNTASIRATVKFSGTAPQAARIQMAADPVCQQQQTAPVSSEEVVVNDNGTLKNVFVYVKEGVSGSYPPPAEPAVLDQQGCWYRPHVLGIQVGQPLEVRNSDATLHNINAKPSANRPFNLAQPVQGMKTTRKFDKPEIGVPFKCNVHPWMSAYAGVVAHPFFAVTDAGGQATINGLPSGTYALEAWHEKYGAQTRTVTAAAGQTASVEWTFTAP